MDWMDKRSIQGGFPPHTPRSQYRLRIHRYPEQDKTLTEDARKKKWNHKTRRFVLNISSDIQSKQTRPSFSQLQLGFV